MHKPEYFKNNTKGHRMKIKIFNAAPSSRIRMMCFHPSSGSLHNSYTDVVIAL